MKKITDSEIEVGDEIIIPLGTKFSFITSLQGRPQEENFKYTAIGKIVNINDDYVSFTVKDSYFVCNYKK